MRGWFQGLLLLICFPGISQALDKGLAESQLQICAGTSLKQVLWQLEASEGPDKERFTGFFETAQLDLYNRQFFVRVRRSKSKVEITLKKNNPTEAQWNDPRLKCETDVHSTYSKRACSYDISFSQKEFARLKDNSANWLKLTNAEAQDIFTDFSGGFDFAQLSFLGEVPSAKWTVSLQDEDVDLDVWFMPPRNQPMMEISMRSPVADSARAYQWLQQEAQKRGVALCEDSVGRTRTLLQTLTQKP